MVAQENATKQTICETCGELVDEDKYQNHLKSEHSKKKEFKCDIPGCEKFFTSNYNLQYHIAHHINARSFLCDECPLAYNTKSDLAQHQRSHEKTKAPTVCNVCGEQFQIKSKFNTHMRSHMGESKGLKECPICKKVVTNLREHYKDIHEKLTNYICSQCNKGFLKKKVLDRHILTVHKKQRNHVRNIRNRDFTVQKKSCDKKKTYCTRCKNYVEDLKHHYDTVHCDLKFVCYICPRRFPDRKHCNAHMLTMHSKERNWLCDYCGKGFTERYKLVRHFRTHAFYFKEKEVVDSSGKKTKEVTVLKVDDVNVKTSLSFGCDICGRSYLYLPILRTHMWSHLSKPSRRKIIEDMSHKGKSSGSKECPICKKVVTHLREHHEQVHEKLKNFFCPECNKGFYRKRELNRHILTVHKKRRDHICNICNRGFGEKSSLKTHERRRHSQVKKKKSCDKKKTVYCRQCKKHVEDLKHHYDTVHCDLKFVCYICHRRFSDRKHCKSHIQTMHSQVRNWLCDYCGKGFIDRYKLVRHFRTHKFYLKDKEVVDPSGKKTKEVAVPKADNFVVKIPLPFGCDICGRSFLYLPNLRMHMRTHFSVPYRKEIIDDPVEPEIMKFETVVVKQEPELIIDQDPPQVETIWNIKTETVSDDGEEREFEFDINTADFDEPENETIQEVNFDSIEVKNENEGQVEVEKGAEVEKEKKGGEIMRKVETGGKGDESKDEVHFTADHNKPSICVQCGRNYKNLNTLNDHICMHHNTHCKTDLLNETARERKRRMERERQRQKRKNQTAEEKKKESARNNELNKRRRLNNAKASTSHHNQNLTWAEVEMKNKGGELMRKVEIGGMGDDSKDCQPEKSKPRPERKSSDQQESAKILQQSMDENCKNIQDTSQSKIDEDPDVPRPTIQCRICTQQFTSREQYEVHFKAVHNKPFTCDLCGRNYKTRRSLSEHKALKHYPTSTQALSRNVPVTCEICKKTCKNRNTYNAHVSLYHRSDPADLTCKYCGRVFTLERNVKYHIKVIHNNNHNKQRENVDENYVCYECGQPFSTRGALTKHKLRIHGIPRDATNALECEYCHEKFKKQYRRVKHEAQVHLNGERVTRGCGYCGMEIKMFDEYQAHVRGHEGVFICMICGQPFTDEKAMTEHEKGHRVIDKTLKKFICDICNHRSLTRLLMKNHMIKHMKYPKMYVCEVCGQKFKMAAALYTHRKYHNEGKYVCSYCGKKCVVKSELEAHMRTHTNEKPFKCTVCNRGFTQKLGLTYHHNTHPETRPSFKCEECNLTFKEKTELQMHNWNHHRHKQPFRCNICKQFFRCEHNLRKHNLHKHLAN